MTRDLARQGMCGLLALALFLVWVHTTAAQDTAPTPEAAAPAETAPAVAPPATVTPPVPQAPDAGLSPELRPLREQIDSWNIELDSMLLAMQRPD